MTDRERCKHCSEERQDSHPNEHFGLCCDCYDLSLGMPLERLNAERAAKGKEPVKPWLKR